MRVPDEIAGEAAPDRGPGEDLDRTIRRLLDGQLYGVLCTQGQGQPYGSLVAYAMTPDLDVSGLRDAEGHQEVPPALRVRPRGARRRQPIGASRPSSWTSKP
ncbi:MAG: hypothetical protein MZW92_24830 [Comamonadaceae bacterium]|nr:hypothetical protein [Comamonadaceae bacterium]